MFRRNRPGPHSVFCGLTAFWFRTPRELCWFCSASWKVEPENMSVKMWCVLFFCKKIRKTGSSAKVGKREACTFYSENLWGTFKRFPDFALVSTEKKFECKFIGSILAQDKSGIAPSLGQCSVVLDESLRQTLVPDVS